MALVHGQLSVFPVRWNKHVVFGVLAGVQMRSPGQESGPRSFSASPLTCSCVKRLLDSFPAPHLVT
jgi:hypothetical protein